MKKVSLSIEINKPTSELFVFTLNPKNTSRWIDGVAIEETNEYPPKIGTKYRNHSGDENWSNYTLIALDQDKSFELLKEDTNYHVRYDFEELDPNTTLFTYTEWVENGDLDEPFTQDILEKLKEVIENE